MTILNPMRRSEDPPEPRHDPESVATCVECGERACEDCGVGYADAGGALCESCYSEWNHAAHPEDYVQLPEGVEE